MKILVAIQPVDFRKQIDGLAAICRKHLQDPFSGVVFVFRNKGRTALKILVYDSQGFWLCHKRLSQGKLKWWPRSQEHLTQLAANELLVLINNGNPELAQMQAPWRKIA
jgi:transposase